MEWSNSVNDETLLPPWPHVFQGLIAIEIIGEHRAAGLAYISTVASCGKDTLFLSICSLACEVSEALKVKTYICHMTKEPHVRSIG